METPGLDAEKSADQSIFFIPPGSPPAGTWNASPDMNGSSLLPDRFQVVFHVPELNEVESEPLDVT